MQNFREFLGAVSKAYNLQLAIYSKDTFKMSLEWDNLVLVGFSCSFRIVVVLIYLHCFNNWNKHVEILRRGRRELDVHKSNLNMESNFDILFSSTLNLPHDQANVFFSKLKKHPKKQLLHVMGL